MGRRAPHAASDGTLHQVAAFSEVCVTGSRSSSLWLQVLVISAALACLGQEANAPPSQEPVTTFQSTTRLVVLDVVVTDKQGKPVRNLSKDDFTIFEDDKPQTVDSFEAPDQHAPVPIVADEQNASSSPEIGPPKIGAQPLTILVFDAR